MKKHNRFIFKLLNGDVLNRFLRFEHKITKSYLDKNGKKQIDYNERKKRISSERSKIERNIITDLYSALNWDTSNLKQYTKLGKFVPDFYDRKKDIYFEITETNIFDYANKNKQFEDYLEHPIIAKINQEITNSKNISVLENNILTKNIEECISQKKSKYNNFDKKINLIIYWLNNEFPCLGDAEDYKEKTKEKIKKQFINDFINFKPSNNIFTKIFLILIHQISDKKYYYVVVMINY